jgi:hypothetical protein
MIKKVVVNKLIIITKINTDQIGSLICQKYNRQMKKYIIIFLVFLTILCSCKTSKKANCDAYTQNAVKDSTVTYF